MSGNGRLITPNQMNVTTTYADGPLAQPSSLPLSTANWVQVLVLGGLTKVEQLAGQIASGIMHYNDCDVSKVAESAINASEAILAECARRREAAKETQ